MGVVYKAQDLVLERFVALKFLPAGRGNPSSRQRFLQEARTASRLDHPNVCTIFEVEEIDWRLHPLLAEFLGADSQASEVIDRMTEWFLARFPEGAPGKEANQGLRWREIETESAALSYWLPRVPVSDRPRVCSTVAFFAPRNGPFYLWVEFCTGALEELTEPKHRSDFLWMLSCVARRHGLFETALEAAYEKLDIDSKMKDEHEVAISWGLIGDALRFLGRFDEAVAVWHQRVIPIQEKLGNDRERAMNLYKMAEVLRLRGHLDEALQVLREEVVPAFEKSRDIRSRAIALGAIADILQAQGDLGSALRIRQTEELPIYEMLGEARSKGVAIGKIAGILHARGEPEKALEISRNQEMPIFERLGDARARRLPGKDCRDPPQPGADR